MEKFEYLQKIIDKAMLKGYSQSTAKNYRNHFNLFLKVFLGKREINEITKEEIERYLRWRQKQKKYSESDQNMHINAIKFYYETVLRRKKLLIDLPRPKKPKKLPQVWSEEDIIKMIKTINNKKHRAIFLIVYAHGLRVSEVVNLKITDIDSKRMQIHIKEAKGKKDRIVNLSEIVLSELKEYYKEHRPKIYLFENSISKEPISIRTVQQIFLNAKQNAGLKKNAGIHSLRHSYATHLHEQGVGIKYIQEFLGHSSIKTTEIYTHVSKKSMSKIKSPLDHLKI